MTLEPGETLHIPSREDSGIAITRDKLCEDAYRVQDTGGELYRGEIKRLAEAAGFEVSEE
jgi:hypothetical protein